MTLPPAQSWPPWPLDSITVKVPLPHEHLSPNSRAHWAAKAATARKAREAAAMCALEALGRHTPPHWEAATLTVRWYSTRRRPDPDNALAMMKASIDGLADALIFQNDRHLRIGIVEVIPLGTDRVDLCVTRGEGPE